MNKTRYTRQLTELMKMISNRCRGNERNTNPMINEMPQVAKNVAAKNQMNRRLHVATSSNTSGVNMLKDHSTDQIVFCWQSVPKKSPNEH